MLLCIILHALLFDLTWFDLHSDRPYSWLWYLIIVFIPIHCLLLLFVPWLMTLPFICYRGIPSIYLWYCIRVDTTICYSVDIDTDVTFIDIDDIWRYLIFYFWWYCYCVLCGDIDIRPDYLLFSHSSSPVMLANGNVIQWPSMARRVFVFLLTFCWLIWYQYSIDCWLIFSMADVLLWLLINVLADPDIGVTLLFAYCICLISDPQYWHYLFMLTHYSNPCGSIQLIVIFIMSIIQYVPVMCVLLSRPLVILLYYR